MQTVGNLHDDSHRPSSFTPKLFRPPFCSTIQHNPFSSSSSADFQSALSNPTTYNPNLYDSMMHHSTLSSYSKPPSYPKPPASDPMLHQSTSSSYSKPPTSEPKLHQSTLSNQPSSSRTSLHQSSSSFYSGQDDEDEYEDEDQIDEDEAKEVEIVDEYGSILRTQKMTAKDVYKLREGEKVLVHVNDTFQLIKGATTVCTRFMTLLLRQPNLCPPEAKDWREIKARCGVLLLGELRKTKYKREPNRIESFDLSYQSNDGSFIHDMSREFRERAREEMNKRELEIGNSRPVDDEARSEIADAVMFDLIGPDKPGQAFGFGTGVTKSKVTKFSFDLRRARKESLMDQYRLLLDKVESQGRHIESQDNQMKIMAKDLSDLKGEVKFLTTVLKEIYGAGAYKDMIFEDVPSTQEEQQQQNQRQQVPLANMWQNLWQNLWQSSMQTPLSGVQNHEPLPQSSQGQATRRHSFLRQQRQQGLATRHQLQPTQSDSMRQQANATNTQQNPLTGQQFSYSDMLQQD